MIRGPQVFYSPGDAGGGDGGTDGGDAVAETPEWMGEHSYFDNNPAAVKHWSKYKSADEAFKGAEETIRSKQGKAYWLPDDASKLTDEQKAEVLAYGGKMAGVPETPDDYKFDLPEGLQVDEDGMTAFRQACHKGKIAPQAAQGILNLHHELQGRWRADLNKVIERMAGENYKRFAEQDCGGDEELAATRLEMVKRLLQAQCYDDEGNADPAMWEKFAVRAFYGDNIVELPILRALAKTAQREFGTGGSPGGGGLSRQAGESRYPTMEANLKRQRAG